MEKLESLLDRLERATSVLETIAFDSMDKNQSSSVRSALQFEAGVKAFDELLKGPVAQFIKISENLGGDVKTQAEMVKKCFDAQKDIIKFAAIHSKPSSQEDLSKVMAPCALLVTEIDKFKVVHRLSQQFNHLSAVAESIIGMGWIGVSANPDAPVKMAHDAAQFYINRVIKDFRDKDPAHGQWTKALSAVLTALVDYINKHHLHGLTWNSQGLSPIKLVQNGVSDNMSGGVPPPPPPTSVLSTSETSNVTQTPDGCTALFAELNRGEAVTSRLRKVTNDMKTHKNPELRAQGGLTAAPESAPESSRKVVSSSTPKVGKKDLQGSKWFVEHFNKQSLTVDITENKQAVFVHNCTDCTIIVKGKANSIMLDKCKKTGVVFDDLISSLDVVNCQNMKVQSLGQLSTVNIDKTDECQVYLSEVSKSAQIITSKATAVNVLAPKSDGDFEEHAIPEQFISWLTDKGLVTECSNIA